MGSVRELILAAVAEENAKIRAIFLAIGGGRRMHQFHRPYNEAQRAFALSLIDKHGFRATQRILKISPMTLHRWCRLYGKKVAPYPPWLPEWVRMRRERLERWQLIRQLRGLG